MKSTYIYIYQPRGAFEETFIGAQRRTGAINLFFNFVGFCLSLSVYLVQLTAKLFVGLLKQTTRPSNIASGALLSLVHRGRSATNS